MPLALTPEDPSPVRGQTYFSDSSLGNWIKPTGIYISPGVDFDSGTVDILIWLHGYYVPGIKQFFSSDPSKVRQAVLASGKEVILVVPYLGNGGVGDASTYNVSDMDGRWGENFLRQVLNALGVGHSARGYIPPWKRNDLSLAGAPQASAMGTPIGLGNLVIACHSGGGQAMRNLVNSLGTYSRHLAECWGFDCLYGVHAHPDDASFWYNWVQGGNGRPLYISFGSSTAEQSVKLYLMGQGLSNERGARRNPDGPEMANIEVSLGVASREIGDLMGIDDLLQTTSPRPGHADPLGGNFVELAASNLRKNVHWPKDLMDMHYGIAREGLLTRLKVARYL